MSSGNILFITIDQIRAGVLAGDLAAHVPTPNLDRLAGEGVSFRQHFTATVPCGPARASLLTGLYAMNHRSIRNGTPLARHHATLGTEMRKLGYEPLLFGYSDASPDPTGMAANDPDLRSYEGVARGFRELCEMRMESGREWPAYLRGKGYEVDPPAGEAIAPLYRPVPSKGANEPRISDPALYAADDSDTAYLAGKTIAALDIRRDRPWFAHVTFIRPHPPLVAPAPYNSMVDPARLPDPDMSRPGHPFMEAWFSAPSNRGLYWGFDGDCGQMDLADMQAARAIYLGLVAEVDHHIGRVLDWLESSGQRDNTLVIVTGDHGEMLGDKRMWGKESVFDPAFHVPLIVRDPRNRRHAGTDVTAPTESIDLMATMLDWCGGHIPDACDGQSLLPWLAGKEPTWRDAAFMEVDFGNPGEPTRFQRAWNLAETSCNAAILREARWKYVHFNGGLPPMLFDLDADPRETVDLASDPSCRNEISRLARKMLDRRMQRSDRRLTGVMLAD